MTVVTMKGEKILLTGPTSQVARPVVRALAADSEVWGVARFQANAARASLEADGVRCVAADLSSGAFAGIPNDVAYVP